MEDAPDTWSSDMLKTFQDLCLHRLTVPFALISKEASIESSSHTLTETSTYTGFIPYEGLDSVPFQLHTRDGIEEYPNHLGYIEITDGPPFASIYACVKEQAPFLPALDKMITESRIFRSKIGLQFKIDGLRGRFPGGSVQACPIHSPRTLRPPKSERSPGSPSPAALTL
jgi:hypothetical protein